MRLRTGAVFAITLPLALVACSGGGSNEPSASTTAPSAAKAPDGRGSKVAQDREALEEAVREYVAAYFKPDVSAGHAMLSAHCRTTVSEAEFAILLDRAKGANFRHEHYRVKRFSVDHLAGDSARVNYGVGEPRFDEKGQAWVREGGVWRNNDC
ncbi:hypothetical protein ACH4SK_34330 [Streptomyces inhibens]|uniref:hypothetical protein n=1 Tax=Streptomyces inhibens TaxID=2293571 RepID=UPI0037BB2F6A